MTTTVEVWLDGVMKAPLVVRDAGADAFERVRDEARERFGAPAGVLRTATPEGDVPVDGPEHLARLIGSSGSSNKVVLSLSRGGGGNK